MIKMRRSVAFILCLLLITGIALPLIQGPATARAAEVQKAGSSRYAKVVTSKGTLSMRAKAKKSAKVVKRLSKGAIVTIAEEDGDWSKIIYKGKTGYVMTKFLEEITELPYGEILFGEKGAEVLAFKKKLHTLGYVKSDDINMTYDAKLESTLLRLQLLNGLAITPGIVTPELQALLDWGMIVKSRSGYINTATDKDSGLTVSLFCWDSDGMLYEADMAVKLKVSFAAQATGGTAPYNITVRKSISGSGGDIYGDIVESPFPYIWGQTSTVLYIYATVVDADGHTVTVCAPFKYQLPPRYDNSGLG